jgi:TolB-like protein/Flp pilus assembly protein TadD
MGEVYRAHDSRLDRDVAVKVLPEHLCRDPDALARFRAEIKALATLEHPNILVLHDVGSEGDVHFAVMELLEGETLSGRLASSALPWRKAVELGVALAEGVGAAHARGIIHRDLKPANVFLTTSGVVKILDFGLARKAPVVPAQAETVVYVPAATEPITICGTAPYMSPEQVIGSPADARSDIFSLGCVLYEMVSGRKTFAHKTQPETLAAILHEEPPTLVGLGNDLPPDLDRVIRHCLEKNPDERFQSARDLAFALRALLTDAPAPPAPRRGPPSARARAVLVAAVLLLAAAGAALYLVAKGGKAPDSSRAVETVAVLPFANVGGDADAEYLSDGLADSLIRNLSQVQALKVRPFSAVIRYKRKDTDAAAAGQALKVQAVVVGRVRKRGEDLSVTVELVDVADNRQLWGGEYKGRLADLLAVQEQMSKDVVASLRLSLTGEEKERLARRYTESAEAHRLYLLGRFYWNKRTGDGLKQAIDYFQAAVSKDRRFALGYAGLADCYSVLPGYGYADQPPRQSFARARAMAARALQLDEALAEAHTALAYVKAHEWDWAGAEEEYRRALRANPHYPTAHQWYACYLATMGRHDEALAEIHRAQDLDPTSLIINGWVAMILCYGDRLDQALEQARYAVHMDPDFAVSHFFLGIVYRRKGMLSDAIAEMQRAVDLDKNSTTYRTGLGELYALSGQRGKARQALNHLAERSRSGYVSPYGVAAIHAALGEKDEAFRWLERAYEARDDGLGNLRIDPNWENLRADPRFRCLLRRMNFPNNPSR